MESEWPLVFGMPRLERKREQIMAIQAFIDGAQTDDEVLVLAGYMASAAAWASFTKEWKCALAIEPKIPTLKSSLAKRKIKLDKEFEKRYIGFYDIIVRHVDASICIAIPLIPFNKICDEFQLRKMDRNPYYFAFNSLIALYSGHSEKVGLNGTVDFIFDDQTEKVHINSAWVGFHEKIPRRLKHKIGSEIAFEQDSKCPPLQAADLIAYWKREEYLERRTLEVGPLVPWETSQANHAHLYGQFDEAAIRDIMHSRFGERYSIKGLLRMNSYPGPWFVSAKDWRT